MCKVSFFTIHICLNNAEVRTVDFQQQPHLPPFCAADLLLRLCSEDCGGLLRASSYNSFGHYSHSHSELLCAALYQQLIYFYGFPAGGQLHSSTSSVYNLLL